MATKTEINHFDDLLHAARAQRARQRLLLVFAGTELPADALPHFHLVVPDYRNPAPLKEAA